MIDLHCHILPGIDDGAANLGVSLGMAQASVAVGLSVVVCTPHILPGLYHNAGPQIASAGTICRMLSGRKAFRFAWSPAQTCIWRLI